MQKGVEERVHGGVQGRWEHNGVYRRGGYIREGQEGIQEQRIRNVAEGGTGEGEYRSE